MSKKMVILIENDLFKLEDMLLSIQSILFVSARQKLPNAPEKKDTTICLLHILDKDEKADRKIFDRFVSILEERQRELMSPNYECDLNYMYETINIDTKSYPPKDWESGMKNICDKIEEIRQEYEYTIILDVILEDDKDPNLVLKKEQILSQFLYKRYSDRCIPYTTYDFSGQTFRRLWAKGVDAEHMPYERYCLDGNVIHKGFKQKIYGHLKIGV